MLTKIATFALERSCFDSALPNCVQKGTQITLSNGFYKKIEDIQVGDKVLTHKGKEKKVLNTFMYSCQSSTYKIDTYGAIGSLIVTEDCEIITLKDKNAIYCSNNNGNAFHSYVRNNKDIHCIHCKQEFLNCQFEYKKAKDLSKSDFVLIPLKKCQQKQHVNNVLAFLTGVYIAEGSIKYSYVNKNNVESVSFFIDINEEQFKNEICEALDKLSDHKITKRTYSQGSCLSIICHDKILAKQLIELAGTTSHNKRLSESIFHWNQSAKLVFLRGYVKGDGCFYNSQPNKHTGRLQLSTCNQQLAHQILHLARTCGINGSLHKFKRTKRYNGEKGAGYTTEYTTTLSSSTSYILNDNTYKVKNLKKPQKLAGRYVNLSDRAILVPITKITQQNNCHNYMHNISVEDDCSYIASDLAIHNCL